MLKLLLFILFSSFTCISSANDLSQPHELWNQNKQKTVSILPYMPVSKLSDEKRVVQVGNFVSHQVNVNSVGENILGDAANEPSIAVNPLNPKQIVIGWRQFNNTNSSFREAGLAYTHDGGESWHNIGPLEPGIFRSDPVLAANADGVFFYQSLAVKESNGQPGLQDDDTFRVDQWRSINGGVTWIDKVNAIGGDKSWYAIDQSDSSNRGNVYAVWNLAGNNHYPKSFNYSVDNGMSYSSPIQMPKSPVYGTVAIGFDGEVYMAGLYGDGLTYGDLNLIKTNNPLSQMFPEFIQVTPLNLGGPMLTGAINPEGLLGQVWVATDKSERHTRGNVYVASSINGFGSDPLDVHFIRSTDDGISFQNPQKINTDASQIDWQWFATMGVAPNGRIDMVWLDTRNAPTTQFFRSMSELFYSYSYDGGLTFSENQAIAPLFNHSLGYPVQRKMGDYIDIVSDNGGAHVAYTATYTGGQDVYYIHAKPAAYEENPYFPSHEMDGIWHNPAVPRQGVLTKTLVQNPNSEDAQLVNFEAVFTETPDGRPTWFVLQQAHPLNGDQIQYVVLYPTGDLSTEGVSLRPIGMVTKSRLYDQQGELIKNKLNYSFDMSDDAIGSINNSDLTNLYSPEFYQNNPFYGVLKQVELEPIVATEQTREAHCILQNLVFDNPNEKAEGRVPVVFQTDGAIQWFVADFTYQKITDPAGNQSVVLDENQLAQPTWQVMNLSSGNWLNDQQIINDIYRPNGGNGFFTAADTDTGVTLTGTETFTFTDDLQIQSLNSDGSVESFNAVAFNSYCGDFRE
ncbi:MAG: sialidase family protein [Marinicella sp.]